MPVGAKDHHPIRVLPLPALNGHPGDGSAFDLPPRGEERLVAPRVGRFLLEDEGLPFRGPLWGCRWVIGCLVAAGQALDHDAIPSHPS